MDTIVRQLIVSILKQHEALVAIAVRQRAKFEGWLKFEIAASLAKHGANVIEVESGYSDSEVALGRADVSFTYEGLRYDLELKTPNTNYQLAGVVHKHRPITNNIAGIVKDATKLRNCAGQGMISFVLFPIQPTDWRWVEYLDRIAKQTMIPLSEEKHTTRLTIPLGAGHQADLIVCCFLVPNERSLLLNTTIEQ